MQYTRHCCYSNNPHTSNVIEWQVSRKGQTCYSTGIYSHICTCSCIWCILIIACKKQDKWRYTMFLEVLCKVNGHVKKLKKTIIPLLCILGRKRWNLKLSRFVYRRKIEHECFLGTYINFMISAVGSVIKMHYLCCNDFQITQMVRLALTTCPSFL